MTPLRATAMLEVESAFDREAVSWFCGHCGAAPATNGAPTPKYRVCESCNLGVLLQARSDTSPGPQDAFVLVDASLTVQAISSQAEASLGVREQHVLNRSVAELFMPADQQARGPDGLAASIFRAARGDDTPCSVLVRQCNILRGPQRARISSCGPPHAALLVLERRETQPTT